MSFPLSWAYHHLPYRHSFAFLLYRTISWKKEECESPASKMYISCRIKVWSFIIIIVCVYQDLSWKLCWLSSFPWHVTTTHWFFVDAVTFLRTYWNCRWSSNDCSVNLIQRDGTKPHLNYKLCLKNIYEKGAMKQNPSQHLLYSFLCMLAMLFCTLTSVCFCVFFSVVVDDFV